MLNSKKNQLLLVIDQGGHASRALVFDSQGGVVSKSVREIETKYLKPDWVEQDAEELIVSVKKAISDAIVQLGSEKHRIHSAGLATQRASMVCWRRSTGQALSPVLSWQDRRAAVWMEGFSAQRNDIHHRTGLFPSPYYGVGKFRWCLDELSDVYSAYKEEDLVMGPLASFIIARLTRDRRLFIDPVNASRTLLFNIHTGAWDQTLLDLFGIPQSVLPTCTASRFSFGHLVFSKQRIPLSLVTGDQSAALFQNGPPCKDSLYINMGTGVFLQRLLKDPKLCTPRLLTSLVLSGDGENIYALEGTIHGAGSALAWFSKTYQLEEWPQYGEAWLEKTTTPPLFINTVGGFASPFWRTSLVPHFIGKGDLAEKFTSVVESILFLIQANIDEMNQLVSPPARLIVSGGISRLDAVCQGLANLSETPVKRPLEYEATSRGLAYLLTKETNDWTTHRETRRFLPRPDNPLQKRYAAWHRALDKEMEVFNMGIIKRA